MAFENARLVRLLDPPELTPRQLAQRRYQKSLKGRIANRRARRKQRQDPAYVAKMAEYQRAWEKANLERRRVYKRTYQQRWRRERRALAESPPARGGSERA